jgi:sulfur-oxidizing protein SoxA
MRKLLAIGLAGALAFAVNSAVADENAELLIEGQKMVTKLAAPEGSPFDTIYSGWVFRTDETQALAMDDFENPAMILAQYGEDLWSRADGANGKSCADCHGDASESMKGLRAQMPKWHDGKNTLFTLEDHINWSREEHQKSAPWKWESAEMLAMTAYIGLQSRGMPVNVKTDGNYKSWYDQGKELYYKRVGQLDMSCAHCHENNWGNMIRADHLSQGMINAFPLYRLKWQGVGSIHRRFKGCIDNIRGTPYKRGSDEFTALELYVASRGQGLSVETPGIRN